MARHHACLHEEAAQCWDSHGTCKENDFIISFIANFTETLDYPVILADDVHSHDTEKTEANWTKPTGFYQSTYPYSTFTDLKFLLSGKLLPLCEPTLVLFSTSDTPHLCAGFHPNSNTLHFSYLKLEKQNPHTLLLDPVFPFNSSPSFSSLCKNLSSVHFPPILS